MISNICSIRAFHGTTRNRAEAITSGDQWLLTDDNEAWLGRGIYFFEAAPWLAYLWAQRKAREENQEPAIISADVTIDENEALNLLDVKSWEMLFDAWLALRDLGQLVEQCGPMFFLADGACIRTCDSDLPEFRNVTDCKVVDHAVMTAQDIRGRRISAVRGAFLSGAQLYLRSHFFKAYQVQIAVMDPSILTSARLEDVALIEKNYSEEIKASPWIPHSFD